MQILDTAEVNFSVVILNSFNFCFRIHILWLFVYWVTVQLYSVPGIVYSSHFLFLGETIEMNIRGECRNLIAIYVVCWWSFYATLYGPVRYPKTKLRFDYPALSIIISLICLRGYATIAAEWQGMQRLEAPGSGPRTELRTRESG